MKIIKSEFEKKTDRNINSIKNSIKRLRQLGFTIEKEETETMFGKVVNHIYLRDRIGNKICLQKHLLTIE